VVAENKKEKNTNKQMYIKQTQDNKLGCDLTNLMKVCNSMTVQSKEEYFVNSNTDIKTSQHTRYI